MMILHAVVSSLSSCEWILYSMADFVVILRFYGLLNLLKGKEHLFLSLVRIKHIRTLNIWVNYSGSI